MRPVSVRVSAPSEDAMNPVFGRGPLVVSYGCRQSVRISAVTEEARALTTRSALTVLPVRVLTSL